MAPTPKAVRTYLAEFLSDPRIVEAPRWLWRLALHGVILRVRPARSARLYQSIWTPAGSPLLTGTEALAAALQKSIASQRPGPILVRTAMRYGKPSIAAALRELSAAGMRRLIVLPLFPQYSGTTTASALDAVGAELARWRFVPDFRFIGDYFAEPRYIEALARSVEAHWQAHGRAERLVLSFHGIPQRYFKNGDPYFCQCQATARALRERLDLREDEVIVSFQSRVGREAWLAPYTDEVFRRLPGEGVKRVQVLCPGFAVDCLETLEEIAIEGRDTFRRAGGKDFHYIPTTNDLGPWMTALTIIAIESLEGWVERAPEKKKEIY